jgi:hypothetical protein
MDMECGKKVQEIVIDMRAIMQMIKNVELEFLLGRMGMFIKVNINQMLGMGMDRCIGMMAVIIKDSGGMGNSVAKVSFMCLEMV